jgi:serine/threonine protein kinase
VSAVPTCDSQNALLKEVGILAKLTHPNLVRFCGVCLDPQLVVMDYCRNGSMFHMLEGARSAIMQGRPNKVRTAHSYVSAYWALFLLEYAAYFLWRLHIPTGTAIMQGRPSKVWTASSAVEAIR